jgi:hypothetical protein
VHTKRLNATDQAHRRGVGQVFARALARWRGIA